tara:strand:+ start:624 stop:806 length:183 start_codon:yes stop_codon:yes gene_type:complete
MLETRVIGTSAGKRDSDSRFTSVHMAVNDGWTQESIADNYRTHYGIKKERENVLGQPLAI